MPKRVLTGTVVSDKGDKTVVVRVERRVKHPLYGKIIKLSKKYHAHDEGNAFTAGEQVRIQECAPVSKLKTWTVLERIGAAPVVVDEIVEADTSKPAAEPKAAKPAKETKAPKAPKGKSAKKAEPEAADA
jgi:small subunit ribosomal protein S17